MRVRSLAGAVRLSMRGKSCSITPTLKMAVDGSRTEEVTFLGSALHGDGPAESPSRAFEEVPVRDETAVGVEPFHPRQSPESVEGHGGGPPSKTLTAGKKQRKVSSKLGPSIRRQDRGLRPEQEPSGQGSGLTGQETPGPLADSSTLRRGASPRRTRQSQIQSLGIPKPQPVTERAFNQQPASGSVGQPGAAAASKLPVKGLTASLSFSTPEHNENSRAVTKASASTAGSSPNERPSRSSAKPGSPAGTSAPSDTAVNASCAVPKLHVTRSRTPTLQARTSAPTLKSTTVSKHSVAKAPSLRPTAKITPAAARPLSQHSLQRSSSARLCRGQTVDKAKQRDGSTKQTHCNGMSQGSVPEGQKQKHQQSSSELMPDVVNGNAPVAPVADFKNTNSVSSATAARSGSRSILKSTNRPQNAAKASAADGTASTKHNQHKEQQAEKKRQAIAQLKRMLIQGNKRVEALATVIQHVFSEREEALKQKEEKSLELANLRDELVMSTQCCKRLQKEKEEMCASFEEAMTSLKGQHEEALVQLENRLKSFYQREWDKVHQIYQEEADKCCMMMEEQVERLRKQQQAERDNQEAIQTQRMDALKLHYESCIQELKRTHEKDLDNLEKSLKQTETSLSNKILPLSTENEALYKKLKEEEENSKHVATEKNVDSHVLYLEQELESLKAVLEIRNNQLHHKGKKLMEMDRMMETNIKLEECLKRVQQENEDYKARMDKYAALSKQLSSEQAVLQQSLQKESKVNKRLSMENEELLWKLQNCDLLPSPCRLSPTSPFNSPRNSATFPTTAPLSPR